METGSPLIGLVSHYEKDIAKSDVFFVIITIYERRINEPRINTIASQAKPRSAGRARRETDNPVNCP